MESWRGLPVRLWRQYLFYENSSDFNIDVKHTEQNYVFCHSSAELIPQKVKKLRIQKMGHSKKIEF